MIFRIKTKQEKREEQKQWHKFFCFKPKRIRSDIDGYTYLVWFKFIYRRLVEDNFTYMPSTFRWEFCLDDLNLLKRSEKNSVDEELITSPAPQTPGTPVTPVAGQTRFDPKKLEFQIFDGTHWISATGPGAGKATSTYVLNQIKKKKLK